ncbi:MAG: AraC family transcriptional regulator [Saprospiraceae bacterium]|nr:MAG: AraC family transcriptional regulator [Saprospiraceae bacterium]
MHKIWENTITKPFEIFKVNAEELIEFDDLKVAPHHHTYEQIIVGIDGELEHYVDFTSTRLKAPYICFVSKGKIHQAVPKVKDGKFDIWIIRFQSELIAETIFQLYITFHNNANLIFPCNERFNRFVTLCELMDDETSQKRPNYAIINHLLSTFFTILESEQKKLINDDDLILTHQNETFTNFLKILEENFRRPLSVEFYAEKLFMSSRNLNLICQSTLQKSVSEILETRRLMEAKNLLANSDLSISEIGFELGYKEKAYFSNVFKKKAGQSPSKFRKEVKQLLS